MVKKRLIISLTFNEGVLFRTKNFLPDYRYTKNFIDLWNADEIILIDVSKKGKKLQKSFIDVIRFFIENCYLPITVGGGISSIEDAKKIFAPPKDKILTSMEELIQNFMIVTEGPQIPAGEVYFEAENPKGALGFYIVSKGGGVPYRMKIRAPSFCNLSILEKMVPGHMLSDITVILGSLDFVMGECDR